jgi:hypothetical protein
MTDSSVRAKLLAEPDIHIISYVPGDAATLEAYRRMGWQVAHRALRP